MPRSARAASWARILLTVFSQVLLVPVFLGHWSVEEYGCWLIVQTIVGLAQLLAVLPLADGRMVVRDLPDLAAVDLVQARIADMADHGRAVFQHGDCKHAGHPAPSAAQAAGRREKSGTPI